MPSWIDRLAKWGAALNVMEANTISKPTDRDMQFMEHVMASRVQHATTHPKFLNSNSTSHSWAFGAVAELVDNAQDPDVMADKLLIDCATIAGHTTLRFADNGLGLDRFGLHKMLSFGHSDKARFEIGRHQAVGRYGNGFRS